jgi:hypothetical protein
MLSKVEIISETQKKLTSDITNISGMNLEKSHGNSQEGNNEMDQIGHDPRIKHNLTYKLNKQVILMILSIMITVPIFLAISFIRIKSSFEIGVQFLVEWGFNSDGIPNACSLFDRSLKHFFDYHNVEI